MRVSRVGKHDTHVVRRVLATVRVELALNATTFNALVIFIIKICKYNINDSKDKSTNNVTIKQQLNEYLCEQAFGREIVYFFFVLLELGYSIRSRLYVFYQQITSQSRNVTNTFYALII